VCFQERHAGAGSARLVAGAQTLIHALSLAGLPCSCECERRKPLFCAQMCTCRCNPPLPTSLRERRSHGQTESVIVCLASTTLFLLLHPLCLHHSFLLYFAKLHFLRWSRIRRTTGIYRTLSSIITHQPHCCSRSRNIRDALPRTSVRRLQIKFTTFFVLGESVLQLPTRMRQRDELALTSPTMPRSSLFQHSRTRTAPSTPSMVSQAASEPERTSPLTSPRDRDRQRDYPPTSFRGLRRDTSSASVRETPTQHRDSSTTSRTSTSRTRRPTTQRHARTVSGSQTTSSSYELQNEFPVFNRTGDVEIILVLGKHEMRYLLHSVYLRQNSSFFEAGLREQWSSPVGSPDRTGSQVGGIEETRSEVGVGGPDPRSGGRRERPRWRYELDEGDGESEIPILVKKV
jgi:hypothetical protein